MLDAQTKQRVDTLRDILVGKIPDPKITLTLKIALASQSHDCLR